MLWGILIGAGSVIALEGVVLAILIEKSKGPNWGKREDD